MKKKVCMVIPSFSAKGGIAAVANGYKDSKLEVDYNIKYVETYCDGNKVVKTLKAIQSYIGFLFLLVFWKPDIVHIHSAFEASFYRKLPFIEFASMLHKPIVNHIHGADFDEFYRNASQKKKDKIKHTYNKCAILIALSDEWKANLEEIVNEKIIVVVENYSVLNDDAISERQEKPNNFNVLFLGFIGQRKGCYDIPAIAGKVLKDVPDVEFVLAGSGEIDEVKALSTNNVKKHLVFPGWVRGEEKDRLLRQADVFFLPSYNEGMPMSILDAMGYGLPIVSTTAGGIMKIVHNGINGYAIEPGNVDEFAKAIVDILKHDDLRRKMGRESVSIIEEKYSLDKHVENIENVYRSLV